MPLLFLMSHPRWSLTSQYENCVEIHDSWDNCLPWLVDKSDGNLIFDLWPDGQEGTMLTVAKDSLAKLMVEPQVASHMKSMEIVIQWIEMKYVAIKILGSANE